MSKNLQQTANMLGLVEQGLNKATLKGSYELNDAFLLKTAHNTITELIRDLNQKGNGLLSNLNLEPVGRCLSIIEQGLRKGNLKGCFELDESHALKEALSQLVTWNKDLQTEADIVKKPMTVPKKTKPLPKVEELVEELEDEIV